jgi:NTE family protein
MKTSAQPLAAGCVLLSAALLATGCGELVSRVAAPGVEPHLRVDPTVRPRLALVLSGGSLRGFAHLGVLKVLEARGIVPDLIVGTSAGSIAGGLYASGLGAEALIDVARHVPFDLGSAWFGRIEAPVHAFVDANLGARSIEDFPIRFVAVATDLQRGCVALFNRGDAAVAVQASASLPGVFAPTRILGRDYADGGLVSPLPVRVARALGAERVIAVNVIFDPRESRLASVVDRLFQTALVMTRTLALAEAGEADVLIDPTLPPEAEVTLANREALIAAGERAALAALPRIRALLERRALALRVRAGELRTCEPLVELEAALYRAPEPQ